MMDDYVMNECMNHEIPQQAVGYPIGTLKTELVYVEKFQTREKAKLKIFDYIEVFYNRQRTHSSIGYKTPVDFEKTKTVS